MIPQKILDWVLEKLLDAHKGKIHGTIVISIENGTITRVRTERIELSPKY